MPARRRGPHRTAARALPVPTELPLETVVLDPPVPVTVHVLQDDAQIQHMEGWTRYPSINDADLDQVDKVRREAGLAVEFVALEKVHGSNFAFETDGRGIEYYSRSKRLGKDEKFVGRSTPVGAMSRYHDMVLEAFRILTGSMTAPVGSIVIYGEYFGGWYPHSDVRQDGPGATAPVQKGIVAYAPDHQFFAFDVCVDGTYLDFDDASELLRAAGFPLIATSLVRGSFADCMAFDVEGLRTTLPDLLSLPPLSDFCIAEGVIVKPVRRHEAWSIKRKSVRYLEACPDELRKWASKCAVSKEQAVEELYLCLCRMPRLDAVLSKDPQLLGAASNLVKIQRLFREDVEEDFHQKMTTAKLPIPQDSRLNAVRSEANRRVAEWLLARRAP